MKAIDKEQIKHKAEQFKWKAKSGAKKVETWCKEHPQEALAIGAAGLAAAKYVSKAVIRDIRINREETLKKLRCYDPSKGHYFYLKRELTNREWLMIDRRRDAGESLPEILEEMRVLK